MSTEISDPPVDPPAEKPAPTVAWWTRGDTNAFFGLGFNILVNVLTLTGLMIGVIAVPAGDVLGTVLPALGVALILGNLYYTFLARRLAKRENRSDVTALPYGPSVPHMFIVVFVVMLPVYLNTDDAVQAWSAGLAWAFMIGVIVMIGAFVGPYIRKLTPRAAMLGTLAGISITFISMRPAAQMWEAAWIGLPVLAIILIGFFTDVKLPFGIPVGLAALLVGTAIGWIGGYMSAPDVGQAFSDIAVGVPDLRLDLLFSGLSNLAPLLGTAIPLGVYNFTEAMSNVESAAAAGDNYNLRSVLLADGAGAVVGSAFGSPFPPAVYIGHPGWKDAGGRASYSLASGLMIGIFCFVGLFGILDALLPVPAIVPILLYIGLLIGAQAFQAVPRLHAIAVVAALLPNLAEWAKTQVDNALNAAGTSASEVGMEALNGAGVVYEGLKTLGEGAVLVGLILGTMVTFILDKKFHYAAIAATVGAVLSFIGLIHAPEVSWAASPAVALGYLFFAAVCLAYSLLPGAKDPVVVDESDIVAGH
ncbi:regulator [Mycobacterium frederiksbergense]|uniref:Regulator n=1 Tax=Mycolicibacterium frederiksbergense TaxID=117567 RepID=A0A6H0SD73_9MYCO|nr:regulator [Mycolicibacterium frederiksbergense]MCV7048887.1 regulator [Mycolicibacterium frederiksbergense]QIV84389.1 regulator [Mycolicibacterium frederiksbergense]